MKALWIPIILQLGAFLVGMAEILIPSMGILSLIAVGLLGYSWYYIIQDLPQIGVWAFLLIDIISIPIFLKFGFSFLNNSSFTLKQTLKQGTGLEKAMEAQPNLVGKSGIVESQLTPTGKATIDGHILEVSSDSEVIEKGTVVTVIEIVGNKIIVKKESNK